MSMEETPLTDQEDSLITHHCITQAVREVLWQTKEHSLITVKAAVCTSLVTEMKKSLSRVEREQAEMIQETSDLKKAMKGLEHILHASYPLGKSELMNKDQWEAEDIENAKLYLMETVRYRDLRIELGRICRKQLADVAFRAREIKILEEAIQKSQEIEPRIRITPCILPTDFKIKSLDLRPGEKQVIIRPQELSLEVVKVEDGQIILHQAKRAKKICETPAGWGFPGTHRVLHLRRCDLEKEEVSPIKEEKGAEMEKETPAPITQ